MAVARSRIDDTILRYASSESPEQIAQRLAADAATAISAAAVAQRRTELLTAPPLLKEAEEMRALDLRLKSIVAQLEESHLSLDHAKVILLYLKEIGVRMDKRVAAREIDVATWEGNMGSLLARSVDLALSFMRGALREEIDADRWDDLLLEGMAHARREIEKSRAVEA